jgi:hypothetical protein
MLSFAVYSNGKLAEKVNLAGAYIVGTDDVPLRADISFGEGIIRCAKRAAGPAGLALLWEVPGVGRVMLETIRVVEREKPYILQVELARARLMRINHKLEDWGLLEYTGVEEMAAQIQQGREVLIRALQADGPAEAATLGEQALSLAADASERLTHYHAEVFLNRRKQSGGFSRRVFGCGVPLDKPTEMVRKRVAGSFDFVTLPFVWRDIEPSEQTFNWKALDAWVEALAKHHVPMKGATLLSFGERHVPDWLYIWEHDFDTIRDLAFEHVRRIINRYEHYVQTWDVISGIHANNCFTFNFEQLMELTRMTAALTKQVAPRSTAIVEVVAPWGEYYARNQRTIPPLLYADMAVQSGVNFDAFGLQFYFGPGTDGMFVRDMFQISSLLDQFAKLGKPLHVTALQVPSDSVARKDGVGPREPTSIDGGMWREPWSEQIQSDWLRAFTEVALSKPFVETIAWHGLADHGGQVVPHGGLLQADLTPKAAYDRLVSTRAEILATGRKDSREPSA